MNTLNMPHHYIVPERWTDELITAEGREAHHLANVLRVKEGDTVSAFDGAGRRAKATVEALSGSRLVLRITEELPGIPVTTPIILMQAIPKGRKMDLIIEKATELGVSTVIPLMTERTVVRIAEDEKDTRVERWTRVAIAAAEQCGTPRIPEIAKPCTLKQALSSLSCDGLLAATLETATVPLREAIDALKHRTPGSVGMIIGPEGDLTATETAMCEDAGAVAVSLGDLVLRSETAAIHGVGILRYEFS